jgi:hypothetical protein
MGCLSGLLALSLFACATRPHGQPWREGGRFQFALIGDAPYSEQDATNGFVNMVRGINRTRLAFVAHDGDIKASSTPCSEALLADRYKLFQSFKHPLIYVFGDNEWCDCPKSRSEGTPEQWLTRLRDIFTQGNHSLGQRALPLTRQSDDPRFVPFRENVRWTCGRVLFAGFNVPGDSNNFGQPEFAERNRANLVWLKDSFAAAREKNLRAIMLIIQANPRFDLAATNKLRAGFNAWLRALENETLAFKKPVVLVHGDTHTFRIDKPLVSSASRRRIENFTRVETFGNPDLHWLRVTVDYGDANVFSFHPMIVPENLVHHNAAPPQRK